MDEKEAQSFYLSAVNFCLLIERPDFKGDRHRYQELLRALLNLYINALALPD